MIARPMVLCPIDFSNASRGALRYAIAIAARFDARLTLLTVDDPILMEAAHARMGPAWGRANSERELRLFLAETLGSAAAPKVQVQIEVATGKAAVEILRVASEQGCDLIVMSTHGRSGPKKMFFGATAERVLRETSVPVLIAPSEDRGPASIDAVSGVAGPVLVPVDFSEATTHQVHVARKVAAGLHLPLLFVHVIEPLTVPLPAELNLPDLSNERLARAQTALTAMGEDTPTETTWDTLIEVGAPADGIARAAIERHAGLIVIGLHTSATPGPRMGSVTYRVLRLAPVLTLALPPVPPAAWLN